MSSQSNNADETPVNAVVSSSLKKKKKANSCEKATFKAIPEKTDREHILDNPDTYIGSVENVDAKCGA
jgi:hypothetical protein